MTKKIKVAINGLGRIGRAFLRQVMQMNADNQRISADKNQRKSAPVEIEVVAVNELGDIKNMAYLLNYDSVYGRSGLEAKGGGDTLTVKGKKIKYLSEKEPAKLPWKDLNIDVVVEATGFFASYQSAAAHLSAGARRVVITAPVKDELDTNTRMDANNTNKGRAETVLMGVNEEKLETCVVSSNASCTTNAASPIIAILDESIGIEKAILNTVHAYTATQSLIDAPAGKKGMREGRAAAVNIVPSSTGAALAVTKAYPKLDGLFDGISLRVPVICGSIADVTFIAKRATSAEEVNEILRGAAAAPRWQGIFSASDDELVSSDIVGATEGAIAELSMTRVVGGNLVKVLAWYDNEMGYASTLVAHVIKAGKLIK